MRNPHFLLMEEGGVGGRERKKERKKKERKKERKKDKRQKCF